MRKVKSVLFLILVFVPVLSYGQFLGLGGQYSEKSDGQFVASFSFPTIHPAHNKLNSFVSSGMEFTTSGGAKMSGLHLKPVQISTFFSEDFFNNTPYTILFGVDGGYLFDFRHDRKNAITITPNLYFDYKFVFVKAGYEFDVSHGRSQYFVRAGVCFGMGTLKMFGNTKIW
ncbi:hypothetical protein [Dysgonomonas macrotermitis]|uniref:Outer membrane protein beta-barrel domain-containing protein n=1 Tax=Dysgonomonas macrotermitis TaxID=1346286 RepID=A0A1M4YJN8_9BACT|nr:hypothetical protein [Dysgonomonas macrotermitis]SHF05940.1 hypothetical protein SAMN05444362_103192 [Dysgonomonas macrotermitis]